MDYASYNPAINGSLFPGTDTVLSPGSTPSARKSGMGDQFCGWNGERLCWHLGRRRRPMRLFTSRNARACGPLQLPGRERSLPSNTVYDSVTGLTWQRNVGPTDDWDAATYCGMAASGNVPNGWRLPQVKELLSIVEFDSTSSIAIDPVAFREPLARPTGQTSSPATRRPPETGGPSISVMELQPCTPDID